MNSKEKTYIYCLIVVSCSAFFIFGFCMGSFIENIIWEKEAIKSCVGEYNSKTGNFQWKKVE